MTLFREEPPEHLDFQFAIACHDGLVECAKEVLRELALVVMTRGSFRGLSMSAPFSVYRSVREPTSKPQGVGGGMITHLWVPEQGEHRPHDALARHRRRRDAMANRRPEVRKAGPLHNGAEGIVNKGRRKSELLLPGSLSNL
jgi:hypothetical protein